MIFCVCGIFTPQLQIWWINLWYICVSSIFLAVCLWETRNLFPLAEIKCKQIEKQFLLCLFLLIKLCFLFCFYSVWIIYYYYYSIINSEIKKKFAEEKRKKSEKVIPALTLFFVLCCSIFVEENQENQKCVLVS